MNLQNDKELTGYPSIDKPWLKYYDCNNLSSNLKLNLVDYIKQKNIGRENYIANIYYGKKTTYEEMYKHIDNASKALTYIGIKKGERILFLTPNIPETGYLWLGATQIGAVSDFADPRPDSMDIIANAKKILEVIKYEKISYIIALDICYLKMITPIENDLKSLGINTVIILSASDSMNFASKIDYLKDVANYQKLRNIRLKKKVKNPINAIIEKIFGMKENDKLCLRAMRNSPLNVFRYKDLLKQSINAEFVTAYEENMLNYIGHTSGTSGSRPKPITLTNENQISSTEQLFKAKANFAEGDLILHELPFFSPLGADNNFILNLASGTANIDIPEFEINEFGYLLKKYHPNVILGTPAWIAALVNDASLADEDLSCLTRVIYGGDSMTRKDEENVNKWLKSHNSKAVVEKGHGMSEYCGCGSYAQRDWNEYESIGIPLPDTIYTLVNPEILDELIEIKFEDGVDEIIGELVVSSSAVTNGKLDNNIIVPHFDLNGASYIRTRDLVRMNRNGIFMFEARKDRSFTRFDGYKIKPYEIEKVVEESKTVKYCKITSYYSAPCKGLMPIAHIVLNNSDDFLDGKKVVRQIINEQFINNPNISSRQIPTKWRIRQSMPLTANSKVDFNLLQKEDLDGSEITVEIEETNLSVGEIRVM